VRLATLKIDGQEKAGIVLKDHFIPLEDINSAFGTTWPEDLLSVLTFGELESLKAWTRELGEEIPDRLKKKARPYEPSKCAPLYRRPRKIWGIGLNYVEHAADLSEKAPEKIPASFMKPDTTLIGPGDNIKIPVQSEKTTAEAELGVIIGKKCRNVDQRNWLDVVAGFTTIIDMTAEDILRQNPRYLTLSKSFDTFISIGPQLVTPDEIDDVFSLTVSTRINNRTHAENKISNMTFPPDYLVSFHSEVMTLLPGDIISTGTPGAAHITDGDTVECRITGFESLINPVVDLKSQ